MHTVAAFFPVARPRGAAAALLAMGGAGRSRVAEAVQLAFAIREVGPGVLDVHGVAAPAPYLRAC